MHACFTTTLNASENDLHRSVNNNLFYESFQLTLHYNSVHCKLYKVKFLISHHFGNKSIWVILLIRKAINPQMSAQLILSGN